MGPPYVPRHRATPGSYGGGGSYERGTPVNRQLETGTADDLVYRDPCNKTHPSRTLQKDYAWGLMGVLGGWTCSYE